MNHLKFYRNHNTTHLLSFFLYFIGLIRKKSYKAKKKPHTFVFDRNTIECHVGNSITIGKDNDCYLAFSIFLLFRIVLKKEKNNSFKKNQYNSIVLPLAP